MKGQIEERDGEFGWMGRGKEEGEGREGRKEMDEWRERWREERRDRRKGQSENLPVVRAFLYFCFG